MIKLHNHIKTLLQCYYTFLEVLYILGGKSDTDLVNLLLGLLQPRLSWLHRCVRHSFPSISSSNTQNIILGLWEKGQLRKFENYLNLCGILILRQGGRGVYRRGARRSREYRRLSASTFFRWMFGLADRCLRVFLFLVCLFSGFRQRWANPVSYSYWALVCSECTKIALR